jgi:hypothetical protein
MHGNNRARRSSRATTASPVRLKTTEAAPVKGRHLLSRLQDAATHHHLAVVKDDSCPFTTFRRRTAPRSRSKRRRERPATKCWPSPSSTTTSSRRRASSRTGWLCCWRQSVAASFPKTRPPCSERPGAAAWFLGPRRSTKSRCRTAPSWKSRRHKERRRKPSGRGSGNTLHSSRADRHPSSPPDCSRSSRRYGRRTLPATWRTRASWPVPTSRNATGLRRPATRRMSFSGSWSAPMLLAIRKRPRSSPTKSEHFAVRPGRGPISVACGAAPAPSPPNNPAIGSSA